MAAGLGFKTFTTGEVLTAADTNGYLMQGINVFASTAARDAAITSPQEGQFAFTKDTNGLWYYDGAAWVASSATGDIEGVTAGTGISGGGTSGTVTITNSMATEITAKADLIVGTGNAAFDNLAVGTNGQVLTADSTVSPTGLKWATPAAGGGMTSIASGSLSGASLSLTSIAGTYKNLILVVRDFYFAGDAQFRCQLNTNTGSVYWNATQENDHTNATVTNAAGFQTSLIRLSGSLNVDNVDNNNVALIQINDYADATSNKLLLIQSAFIDSSTNRLNVTNNAVFNNTTAITSIQIFPDSSTFSGGTYVLYGVS